MGTRGRNESIDLSDSLVTNLDNFLLSDLMVGDNEEVDFCFSKRDKMKGILDVLHKLKPVKAVTEPLY